MHVHASQLNPNAALDAAYAAQKAAANREAAETRRKLMDSASRLAAEGDSFVARAGDEEESSKEPKRRNQQSNRDDKGRGQKQNARSDAEEGRPISDWA